MAVRLTERSGDGIRYDNGQYIVTCYPKNNNLTPVDKMAAKLCDLEDKIENGTLVAFPCRVGDELFELTTDYKSVVSFKLTSLSQIARYIEDEAFGTWLFKTREEAEAALKERSGQ